MVAVEASRLWGILTVSGDRPLAAWWEKPEIALGVSELGPILSRGEQMSPAGLTSAASCVWGLSCEGAAEASVEVTDQVTPRLSWLPAG